MIKSEVDNSEKTKDISGIFKSLGADSLPENFSQFSTMGVDKFDRSFQMMPVNGATWLANPITGSGPGFTLDGGLLENANGLSINAGFDVQASDVTQVRPFFHTPGNAQDAFDLPKSYIEQIRWSRLMYNLNAYIGSLTDLKAFYAYSRFDIVTSVPYVSQFYKQNAFNKNFSLYKHVLMKSLLFHKFGEAISWGARKQDGVWPKTQKPRWVWEYFVLLEPELVEIKKSLLGGIKPQYFLRPSRDLEDLINKMKNNDPEVARYQDKISPLIIDKVEKRELIPIDNSTISSIQNLTDASATRGTPPYQRLFVTYIMEDFVRLAQMSQAQRYHFPVELWTLGNLEKNILPNPQDLAKLRDLVTNAIQSPPFSIFFPPILDYKAFGVSGKLLSIKDDYDYIWRQYTVGMGVSEDIILGNTGIFSSKDTSSNQAFIRARKKERDDMEDWMTWNFFEPLARWNNLQEKQGDILAPILPDIHWDKVLDYTEEEQHKEDLKYMHEKGIIPTREFLIQNRKNPEECEQGLKAEIGTVFDDGKRVKAPDYRKSLKKGKPDETAGSPEGAPTPEGDEIGEALEEGIAEDAVDAVEEDTGTEAPEAPEVETT